jgi:hypothetical protein
LELRYGLLFELFFEDVQSVGTKMFFGANMADPPYPEDYFVFILNCPSSNLSRERQFQQMILPSLLIKTLTGTPKMP